MTITIEVSAVRGFDQGTVELCAEPLAEAFGVYIRNPLAFHVQDFMLVPEGKEAWAEDKSPAVLRDEARRRAVAYADALAEHIGCAMPTLSNGEA